MAQSQDLLDVLAVVEIGACTLVRGACRPGTIESLPQGAILGMGHDGLVRWWIEAQAPAIKPLLRGIPSSARHVLARQARKFGLVFGVKMPAVCRILDVLIEPRLHGCQLLHEITERLFLVIRQCDASQAKVPQRMIDQRSLRHIGVGR